ncbi:hypothetical protein SADUNF_Sadunf01G0037200 [Salix dunnii]|uniref:WAT1-related protein n=1 Tax=Salix dunnii TaxID=1413687 RepID=A0A835N9R3_9ROSI|nr:hypothetical protein SADUNF_Sadunf01G0037200 [Salix dunnii]
MLKPGHIFESLAGLGQTMLAVAVQIGYAAVVFFSSMVEKSGMSMYIIVAYRLMFAAVITVTLALIFARKCRPKLTWTVLFQAFLAGLLGGPMAQILLGESISLSSVTFGMALINLIPAMTLALAIAFRLDSLRMRTASGRAKLFGIVIGLCGGMLFTLYRGPKINTWSTYFDPLHLEKLRNNQEVVQPRKVSIRFLAVLYALGHCICNSLWLIIQSDQNHLYRTIILYCFYLIIPLWQAKVSEGYRCQYSGTAIISTMAAIQAVIFALCHYRTDHSKWSLGWDARLIVTVSGGIFYSTSFLLNMKVTRRRGPLFVSIFNPLALVMAAILGSILLGEKWPLGSMLGAALVVFGYYMVFWGKSKEIDTIAETLVQPKSCPEPELVAVAVK